MRTSEETVDPDALAWTQLALVITGPSGSGKDAIVRRMEERGVPFSFVVTTTDRKRRRNEVHGRDYFFVTKAEFQRMIAAGELLECAEVYGQHKGIPRAHVLQALATGLDVIMRVDVQGATTVKTKIPAVITLFVTCESEAELVRRLRRRRTEGAAERARRLDTARQELARMREFDYVVVNRRDQLDAAVDDVVAILRAAHCRTRPEKVAL